MGRPIEDIEAELREARARQDEERKRIREATPVVRRFAILPYTPRRYDDDLYDDSCRLYEIKAEIVNAEEAKAAGHPEHALRAGGMVYIFNTLSGRIVYSTGGGTVWIGSGWNEKNRESANRTMTKISEFLVEHPAGGDITEIVNEHRNSID